MYHAIKAFDERDAAVSSVLLEKRDFAALLLPHSLPLNYKVRLFQRACRRYFLIWPLAAPTAS